VFDKEIAAVARTLPDFDLFDSLPGAGPHLTPRLLAAFGEQRDRFKGADELSGRWLRNWFRVRGLPPFAVMSRVIPGWRVARYDHDAARRWAISPGGRTTFLRHTPFHE
jgi:hypothetical protein